MIHSAVIFYIPTTRHCKIWYFGTGAVSRGVQVLFLGQLADLKPF